MTKSKKAFEPDNFTIGWYETLGKLIDFSILPPAAKPILKQKVGPKGKWMGDRTAILDLFPPKLPIVPRREMSMPELPLAVWEIPDLTDPDLDLCTFGFRQAASTTHQPIFSEPIPIPRNKGKWTPNADRPNDPSKWLNLHLIFYHNTCVKKAVDFSIPGRARDVYLELQKRSIVKALPS